MTLRRKIPLVTGLSLLAWIAALIVVSQLVILGSFRGLENDDVKLNVERAQTAVSSELDSLRSVAGDWAPWDDAYAFILGKNPGFIASNLTDKSIQNLALDFMVYLDARKSPITIMFIDIETGKAIPVPHADLEAIVSCDCLFSVDAANPGAAGIVDTARFPVMAAAHQILRTDFSGPSAGWLVVGRYLDAEEVKRLSEITHLNLSILPASGASRLDGIAVKPLDGRTVAGWTSVEDLQGKRGFSLRVLEPRTIFIQGERTLLYFYIAVAAMGVFVIFLVTFYLARTLLFPLSRLSYAMMRLEPGREKEGVGFPPRGDELGALARSVDGMLLQIADNRAALLEQSYSLGKAEVISEILHGVRNTLNPMMGEIEMLEVKMDSIPERELMKALEELGSDTTPPERKDRLRGFLLQASADLTALAGEAKGRLKTIGETAARVEEILDDQERWSHAARSAEQVEVGMVIREAMEMAPDRAHIDLSWKKSPDSLVTALANPILLRQVMTIVLQHMGMEARRREVERAVVEVDGWLEASIEGTRAHVTITDPEGRMDPGQAKVVFSGESTTDPQLSWCTHTVALMNGGINVENCDDRGVRFHLRLPA